MIGYLPPALRPQWQALLGGYWCRSRQALAKLSRREKIQEAIAAGAKFIEPEKPRPGARRPLASAADKYLGDIAKYKAFRTYKAYRLALETFLKTCTKDEPAMFIDATSSTTSTR